MANCQPKVDEGLLMFYNVENLFDTFDDPDSNDDEFTPAGSRHWNNNKLNNKVAKIAKVVLAAGEWDPPWIIGLCEVENRTVLEQLSSAQSLKGIGYKIVHKESPDHRGIDVALLYREDMIKPLNYHHIKLKDEAGEVLSTREILYFKFIVDKIDTIHLFLNHWPSRYGGLLESEDKRGIAALTLRNEVDLLINKYNDPKIIILGDFNDQPYNESILSKLAAKIEFQEIKNNELYNLSSLWDIKRGGTHKYQSQWSIFDQVIVSGSLLNTKEGFRCTFDDAYVYRSEFLLEKDEKYGGVKPYRTYVGYKHNGGFSDHLPVLLRISKQ